MLPDSLASSSCNMIIQERGRKRDVGGGMRALCGPIRNMGQYLVEGNQLCFEQDYVIRSQIIFSSYLTVDHFSYYYSLNK